MPASPTYTCPVCKRGATEEAEPVTRTTVRGRRLVVALRRRCTACGYTDRTTMFRGATSLNWDEHQRDIAGKRLQYGEEVED